jgi:hypothetical protein
MTETQELYTKWLRECPGAMRFSIELFGPRIYEWRVSSMRSEHFGPVILKGSMISGKPDQIRQELCRQLKNTMVGLDEKDMALSG